MDRQRVYETVARHLIAQGVAAQQPLLGEVSCCYKTREGLKCAIGCLIPDDLYDPSLEGNGVVAIWQMSRYASVGDVADPRKRDIATLVIDALGLSDGGHQDDLTFLSELQQIHDNRSPREWSEELEEFRLNHGLAATSAPDEPLGEAVARP